MGAETAPVPGKAKVLLEGLLNQMGIEASVAAEPQGDSGAELRIESPDAAVLVGEEGRGLEALQYLLNRMLRRACGPDAFCIVDAGGHRERRRAAMGREARDMADRVRQTRSPFVFPPLSPADRRAIHRALAEDPDVETVSIEPADIHGCKAVQLRLRPAAPPPS
jgi:spoIIIJ-associated protein